MVGRQFLIALKELLPEWQVEYQYPTEVRHLYWILGGISSEIGLSKWEPKDIGRFPSGSQFLLYRTARLTPECHYTGSNNLGGY
jgi:hypothetical protein